MFSTADEEIGFGDIVWGRYTSQIPGSDGSKIYNNLGHNTLKAVTCAEQLKIITKHTV